MQNYKFLVTLAITLSLWQVVCSSGFANPVVVASPIETSSAFLAMAQSGMLHRDTVASLGRVFGAVILACVVAVPAGLLLVLLPTIKQLVRPLIDFLRTIPPIAFFPPLVVAFGPYDMARILTAALGAALVIGLIVATACPGMESPRATYYRSQGAPRIRVLCGIVLPEAIPSIVIALRAGASLAFVFVIVTELYLGSEFGLGSRLQYAQVLGNTPEAYAAMFAIGVSGTLLNQLIDRVEAWTVANFGDAT